MIRTVLLSAACALLLAACGGSPKYALPVDSPIKPFQKPEAEELTGEEIDPLAEPTDDEEEFEDPMADDDDDTAPPAAKAPAAKEPAKKAKK